MPLLKERFASLERAGGRIRTDLEQGNGERMHLVYNFIKVVSKTWILSTNKILAMSAYDGRLELLTSVKMSNSKLIELSTTIHLGIIYSADNSKVLLSLIIYNYLKYFAIICPLLCRKMTTIIRNTTKRIHLP